VARPAMVMGIETEYGIYARGNHGSRYAQARSEAAAAIRRAVYNNVAVMGRQLEITVGSRHVAYEHIANGARFYIDIGDHPEMSIAECSTPREAVIWDAAGERIVQAAAVDAAEELGYGVSIVKKLTDVNGTSWGCHENYSIDPTLFYRITKEEKLVAEQRTLATWFVVRQLLIGGGKVGSDGRHSTSAYQISQRADFMMEFRNDHTMHDRPIIQVRDQPLADGDGWRRLHVICGDANLCQWSTYLKMALTGLLLLMWQDPDIRKIPPLPVIVDEDFHKVMQFISCDSDLVARYPVRIAPGRAQLGGLRHMTAAEILSFYTDALAAYALNRDWSSPADASAYQAAALKAQWAAGLLRRREWRALNGWLDWPTKRVVVEEYLRRKGKNWTQLRDDDELMQRVKRLADHNYAALDPAVSMFARLQRAGTIRTVVKASEIGRAIQTPPSGRAAQRAAIAEAYAPYVRTAHWDTIVLNQNPYVITIKLVSPSGCPPDLFSEALRRCPEPLDLMAYLEYVPIFSLSVTAERKLSNA
jgi:Pup amidohydrolase